MHFFMLIFAILTIACSNAAVLESATEKVNYLEADNEIIYTPYTKYRGITQKNFRIYCYGGVNASVAHFFESLELLLDIDDNDYQQYLGKSPEEVKENYDNELFSISFFTQKTKRLNLSPFSEQCVGIETAKTYKLHFHRLRIDIWRIIRFSIGVLLFYYARNLSQNAIFYYGAGILLGICSSFMLVIWLSSKLIPRRPVMYGVLLGGWTIGVYIFQLLWDNIRTILLMYRSYVFWYIFITGFLSFLFCYRMGPPKNKRSKDIIKWILQLFGIIIIYCSSNYEDAALSACIVLLVVYLFPKKLIYTSKALFIRRFPVKRRLLTESEYYKQGVEETAKALQELRQYASSPECKQWRVMTKLREPYRFASFVEGSSHLLDDEILSFDNFSNDEGSESVTEDDSNSSEEIIRNNRRVNKNNRQQQHQQPQQQQRHQQNNRDDLSEDDEEESSGTYNSFAHQNNVIHRPTGSRLERSRMSVETRQNGHSTSRNRVSNQPNYILRRNQVNNTNGYHESDDDEMTD